MPLTRLQGRAIWYIFAAANVVLATAITYKRPKPSKPAPDRNRTDVQFIPTYQVTDEELIKTYDVIDRLQEAQCLYRHGQDHHIERAGQICDELLQEPGLPPGICVQVLILLMSIEQDTDTVDKLLVRAEGLYNIISLCHPPGYNENADEIITKVRKALDIITENQKEWKVDEEDDGQALWSDEEGGAGDDEDLEEEFWSDDSAAGGDGDIEEGDGSGEISVGGEHGPGGVEVSDGGVGGIGSGAGGFENDESSGTAGGVGASGGPSGLGTSGGGSTEKYQTFAKASSYKPDTPHEPWDPEAQKKTEQEEEDTKLDATTRARAKHRARRAIVEATEERLRRKGWIGEDETILLPEEGKNSLRKCRLLLTKRAE
jgi:hypothetical protein